MEPRHHYKKRGKTAKPNEQGNYNLIKNELLF